MTKNEVGSLIKMIMTVYPNEYAKTTNMDGIVGMWMSVCSDYSGEQMAKAFRQYLADDTSGFAPKPGQLIKYIKPERSTTNNFADMESHGVVIDDAWWAALAARPGNLI